MGTLLRLRHAELTSDDMQHLSAAVRFTAICLRMMAQTYGQQGRTRLNLHRLKGLYFSTDDLVTLSTLETDVLELASVGHLRLSTGDDGEDWYEIVRFTPDPADDARRAANAGPAPGPFPSTGHRSFIGSEKEREERDEGEGEPRDEAPTRPPRDPGPPPALYCSDHMPSGSGGEPCVLCQECSREFETWRYYQRTFMAHNHRYATKPKTRPNQQQERRSPRFEEDDRND